jgi:hypothetical protein
MGRWYIAPYALTSVVVSYLGAEITEGRLINDVHFKKTLRAWKSNYSQISISGRGKQRVKVPALGKSR